MLQIVHDIAPGASLAFATAQGGQTVFADNIRALAAGGADIIADDIIYFGETAYQDGIVAKAVNDVTSQGVAYFSMAFNNNGLGINSFEAPAGFQTTACPVQVTAQRAGGGSQCVDFDPGAGTDPTFNMNLAAGTMVNPKPFRLSLSWAEPQFGVTTDLDAYVFNPDVTGSVSLSAETDNIASQSATDFGSFDSGGGNRELAIRIYSGGAPQFKFVSNDNGANTILSTQAVTSPYVQGPTIYGHNGADASITVGAVPFNNSNTMEAFSGRGPVRSIFAPINGATPSAAFGSPQVLSKPDVSATDRGITSFFGSGNRFGGTSAATPHAAAVGALQLSANPALTRDQIEAAQKATARPVGAFGPLDMGAGLIDAQAAIASTPPAPGSIAITNRPGPTTNDSTPTFEFAITGHPNVVTCTIDDAAAPCTSPFTPALPLADGNHTLTVAANDFFGQTATPAAASFATDTTAPSIPKFAKGPKKKTKSNKATFNFSSESGATFMCALDNAAFAACTSPAKVKVKKAKPKKRKHSFEVEAVDAVGNVGASAVYKWTVVKKKKHHH
jgi:subtilisin family serine protease